jgi:hypothetical protein
LDLRESKIGGGWRRMQNEELHNLYASPNIIREMISRRMRWAGHVALMGRMRNIYIYNIVVKISQGKRLLERPRLILEDSIRMYLRQMG